MDRYVLSTCILVFFLVHLGRTSPGRDHCTHCPNYGTILKCDPQTCDWLLLNGYWAGNITEGGEILVGLCPLGYCLYNESSQFIRIPSEVTPMIGDFLCNGTRRTGVLCSQCQPGNALAINSDIDGYATQCVSCDGWHSKINWLYYLLVVYLPLLVFFLVIIFLNIRLTNGPVNSFILFAQVISTTLDINQQGAAPLNVVYGGGTEAFQKSYQIPYKLFNLNLIENLFPPFCLHESIDSSNVLLLRYIEGFFPLLIIVVILFLLRCQKCFKVCSKLPLCCEPQCRKYRIGTSPAHAFAAFVLLSYNRLCQTTSYLLTHIRLFNPALESKENRIFYQGNYASSDSNYTIPYKLVAYLVTVLLVAMPIALFHYPLKWVESLVSKVGCLRNVYPTASIAILLDTFQGCFKDNRRYFAGLYLALRLLLFYTYQIPTQLRVQQMIIIVYIVLLSVLKPYKDRRFNFLDIAIFANLAVINALSVYTANVSIQNDRASLSTCIIIESILIFLPMACFVAFLVWHFATRCGHEGACAKVKNSVKKRQLLSRAPEEKASPLPRLSPFEDRSKYYMV